MLSKTAQRLYDYTRSHSSGIAVAEINIHSFLKNLYLETSETQILPRLVYNGDFPVRKAQAYDDYLDRIGAGLGVFRGPNETDEAYRQKLKLSIIKSPSVTGLENSIATVFSGLGFDVSVKATPAVDNFFDGVSSTFETPVRGKAGARLYRIDITINPGLRVSYPNFLYEFNLIEKSENNSFVITEPGRYGMYLNAFSELIANLGVVEIYVANTQFPLRSDTLVYSAFNPAPGTFVDLGFLSNFQELYFRVFDDREVLFSLPNVYNGYLTVNDSEFAFYRNPEYNTLTLNFGVDFLREIFGEVSSFGIIIERIAVKNAGTGGQF